MTTVQECKLNFNFHQLMLLRANDNILKRFDKKHGKFFPPVIQREFLETMAMNILLEIKENIH